MHAEGGEIDGKKKSERVLRGAAQSRDLGKQNKAPGANMHRLRAMAGRGANNQFGRRQN